MRDQRRIAVIANGMNSGNESLVADQLRNERLDAIVYLGNAVASMHVAPEYQSAQLETSMRIFNDIGVPTYWMPGQHEHFLPYVHVANTVMDDLDNIIDCANAQTAIHLAPYLDLVFLPGATMANGFFTRPDIPTGAFQANAKAMPIKNYNPQDICALIEDPPKTLLLTNQPPQYTINEDMPNITVAAKFDIDERTGIAHMSQEQQEQFITTLKQQGEEGYLMMGEDAYRLLSQGRGEPMLAQGGNPALTTILEMPGVNIISGMFPEAAGAFDWYGNAIPQCKKTFSLYANPGGLCWGDYAIATFKENMTAAFERRNLFGEPKDHKQRLLNSVPLE